MRHDITPVDPAALTPAQVAALPPIDDFDALGSRLAEIVQQIQRSSEQIMVDAVKVGLLLAITKSRMPRGKWRAWLEQYFPKSTRAAERYLKLACSFCREKRVLLPELSGCEQLALGLPSPETARQVERKVRSFCRGHESLTELMRAKGVICQGGNRYERHDGEGNLVAGKGSLQAAIRAAEAAPEQARAVWNPLAGRLYHDGLQQRTWVHLSHRELQNLHGILVDLSREIREALELAGVDEDIAGVLERAKVNGGRL